MKTFKAYWDNKAGKIFIKDAATNKVLLITSNIKTNYAKQRELVAAGWVSVGGK